MNGPNKSVMIWVLTALTAILSASFGCGGNGGDDTGSQDVIQEVFEDSLADTAGDISTDEGSGEAISLDKPAGIALAGAWTDAWGTMHDITSGLWLQNYSGTLSSFEILIWNNGPSIGGAGWAVARNSNNNQYSAGLFSRFDWTTKNGTTYFCNTAWDKATSDEAIAVQPADASDPANSGCGGFGWTGLTAVEPPAPEALPTDTRPMDLVVEAPGASGEGTGDPRNAVNGVRGGGALTGGTDVYSISAVTGSFLVLALDGFSIGNGPGAELVVFENPFNYGDGGVFMDQTIVQVSRDGITWVSFPFDFTAEDETSYSTDPAYWDGFAGVTPVIFNQDIDPNADPFNAETAGGDAFDLDRLDQDDPDAAAVARHGFRFVRLLPARTVLNPDTEQAFVSDPISNGPDIDGIYVRYAVEN
ncbi:MAG TPA: LIC_13355 family lipoprotein [Myxococcota bacterium]|nr:LIC_13355 family lipoprotein [Myxococcota bacterium]